MVSDRPVDSCGIEWSLESEEVRSMPRRAAKITQSEIARVIRAAREAGATEVIVDGEGQIRVVLSPMCRRLRRRHPRTTTRVQSGQCPCLQERNGGHLAMPLLGAIFQNTCSDLDLLNRQVLVRCDLSWPTITTTA